MIRLHNVIDKRTGLFHSTVICKPRNAKWYVPAEEEPEEESAE